MKIIKISTELELSVYDFPIGTHSEQNDYIKKLIGNDCKIYERVRPGRLYSELKMPLEVSNIPGKSVSMLVDEEGLLKPNIANIIGSYLYETDKHNFPIMGNVIFVGEKFNRDGIDFCGIEEATFKDLKKELISLIQAVKATKEVLGK